MLSQEVYAQMVTIQMRHSGFLLLVLSALSIFQAQGQSLKDGSVLVKKIQEELAGPFPPPDAEVRSGIPHGELLQFTIANSKIYPGTENHFQVFVPAQYNPAKPACLLVKLDGLGQFEGTVLDNLIAAREVPVMVGLGIQPGSIPGARFNRSYEFDSMNDQFPDFVLNEVLPAVEKLKTADGRPVRISPSGNDHAATGASTGGIGSFTLAWRRPDQFTRVYSVIGTFVSMRGGNEYPVLVRKTEPKTIRIFLEDGSGDAWNPLFGSWFDANLNMESALSFAGYDVAHAWGTHGHNGRPGQVIFADVLRWLWRDYPTPVEHGLSNNSTLREITLAGEDWRPVPHKFEEADGLAARQNGDVYVNDPGVMKIYKLEGQGTPSVFRQLEAARGIAFGPDGLLYGLMPSEKRVISIDPQGHVKAIADGVAGQRLVVTHRGDIYVSQSGAHTDMASRLWKINGTRQVVDEGLRSASGVALSPEGNLFYAAEAHTQWIYSYVVQPDGTLRDKQRFYWLHTTDIPDDSGAEELAVDIHGNLYVATRLGIQVCDQNGRVRAILPLPSPSGAARSLCFGGERFETLYVTDGHQVFARKMRVAGAPPWAAPMTVPSQGPG